MTRIALMCLFHMLLLPAPFLAVRRRMCKFPPVMFNSRTITNISNPDRFFQAVLADNLAESGVTVICDAKPIEAHQREPRSFLSAATQTELPDVASCGVQTELAVTASCGVQTVDENLLMQEGK
jgi:hypothetical protein